MKKSFVTCLFLTIFLFSSCSNFLDGASLKSNLNSQIDYSRNSFVKVSIEPDVDSVKKITPLAGEYSKEWKKGDFIELKFANKDSYIFKGWTCVPENAVEFFGKDQFEAKVQILRDDTDIKIYPVTYLIPAVQSFYPPLEQAGFPQDTSIVIRFNKNLETADFAGFSNITISDEKNIISQSFSSWFQKPVFIDERTIEIRTVKGKNILNPGENLTDVIFVKLSLSGIKDKDGLEFTQKDLNFQYKINSSIDEKSPVVLESLKATKLLPEIVLKDKSQPVIELNGFEKYSAVSEADLEEEFEAHHVGSKIHLSAKFKDEESGIKFLRIKEKLIKTAGNVTVSGTEYVTEYSVNDKNVFYDSLTKECSYSEDYSFVTKDDGVISLDFEVEDYAGNVSKLIPEGQALEVIKDTIIIRPDIKMIKEKDGTNYKIAVTNTSADAEGSKREYYFIFNGKKFYKYSDKKAPYYSDYVFKNLHFNLYTSSDNVNWQIVPENNSESKVLKFEFSPELEHKEAYYPVKIFDVELNPEENLYLKAELIDTAGNIFTSEHFFAIQKAPEILHARELMDSNSIEIVFSEEPAECYIVLLQNNNESDLHVLSPVNAISPSYSSIDKAQFQFPSENFVQSNDGYKLFVVPAAHFATRTSEGKGLDYYLRGFDFENAYMFDYKDNLHYEIKNLVNPPAVDFLLLHGNPGKAFTFNRGQSIPDDAVPAANQILITETTPVQGEYHGILSYTNGFTENPSYTYIIRQKSYGGTVEKSFVSKELNFGGVDGHTYYSVVAIDGMGNEKESETVEFIYTADISAPKVSINLSAYSDYTGDKGIRSDTLYWLVTSNRYESLSSIQESSIEEIQEMSYLFTNEKLNTEKARNLSFNQIKTDWTIAIDSDNDDFKWLNVRLKDRSGNESIFASEFTRHYVSDFYNYNYSGSSLNLTVPAGYKMSYILLCMEYTPASVCFSITDLKSKKQSQMHSIATSGTVQFDLKSLDISEKTFIKIDSQVYNIPYHYSNVQSSTTKVAYFPYTTYLCPDYEQNKVPCNLKNVIKGEMGLSILCDQVAFAHTLYSAKNYGSDVLQNDFAVWETKGYEADEPVVCDSSFTYLAPEIPQGYWYTTIVHFADGSVYQTAPVKK